MSDLVEPKPLPKRDEVLGLLAAHREAIRSLGVARLGLFGSCAREDGSDGSDLDFVVQFENKSFDAYMDLKELLKRLFGRAVDLVTVEALKPRLRATILAEAAHAEGL